MPLTYRIVGAWTLGEMLLIYRIIENWSIGEMVPGVEASTVNRRGFNG